MKIIAVSTIILLSGLSALPARAAELLTGTAGLACQAQLCLSAGSAPAECEPSLSHYFGIDKPTWPATKLARKAFLKLCPTSEASAEPPTPVASEEAVAAYKGALDGQPYMAHDQKVSQLEREFDVDSGAGNLQGAYEGQLQATQDPANQISAQDAARLHDQGVMDLEREFNRQLGNGNIGPVYGSQLQSAEGRINVTESHEVPENFDQYPQSFSGYGRDPDSGTYTYYGATPHHPASREPADEYRYDTETGAIITTDDWYRRDQGDVGHGYGYDSRANGIDFGPLPSVSSGSGYDDYASADNSGYSIGTGYAGYDSSYGQGSSHDYGYDPGAGGIDFGPLPPTRPDAQGY